MSYVAEYDLLVTDTNDLHKKANRAIDKAARDVINEDPGTTNHANRLVWAVHIRKSIDNMQAMTRRWMVAVLDNATVAAAGNAATDNDVQFVVNALVDTMANDFAGT